MPINRTKALLVLSLACLLTLAASAPAFAQMLARPGWAGFGQKSEAWWKHPIVYEVDPHGFSSDGLKGIAQRLDYIHSLGADAILLTHIEPDAAHPQELDPAIGTLDDLDDLSRTASSRNMRILLDLGTLPAGTDLNSLARLWLNRGLAGFRIANPQQADELRKIAGSYIGERIIIGDLDPAGGRQQPQLLLDASLAKVNQFSAAALRPVIEAIQSNPNSLLLATDGPGIARSAARLGGGQHNFDIAKILAAALLTNRASSLIYYGQEIGLASDAPMSWGTPVAPAVLGARKPAHPAPVNDPVSVAAQETDHDSLLNWYRQLSALHHSNRTLSSAPSTMLNHDDQNVLAWVRRPEGASLKNPPLVVICNLSAQPVHLSLKDDMQKLHLKGNFLRTVIRSDKGMGPMTLDSMTLPPFTIYIGELKY